MMLLGNALLWMMPAAWEDYQHRRFRVLWLIGLFAMGITLRFWEFGGLLTLISSGLGLWLMAMMWGVLHRFAHMASGDGWMLLALGATLGPMLSLEGIAASLGLLLAHAVVRRRHGKLALVPFLWGGYALVLLSHSLL